MIIVDEYAYKMGRSARYAGLDILDCPYSSKSKAAKSWRLGWDHANSEIRLFGSDNNKTTKIKEEL